MSRPRAPSLPAPIAIGAAGSRPWPAGVESDSLAQAFADCETLIAQGLLALARREREKERRARVDAIDAFDDEEDLIKRLLVEVDRHHTRAGALEEAALAVSVGQFRTDEYDLDPDALANAHFRAANAAGFVKARRGGVARAAALSPARRESIARGAAIARWWEPQCGHAAGQACGSPVGGTVYCEVCNEPYKRKNVKGEHS